ncbi:SH3, type 3 [Trichodesmium erythraeum IMS101]|uniref:SH3, type 3 n=1 Tax=Trichodesmium erythraeum (strain IMS101) TaxID=203124 RepID=Q118D0_TRIEI|nr:SH3 domain-containing protein [Trichodesmium erythraeum GBRTRLIN201]MCH2050927.1 SH3 domain-containing protein [Trichodesmium sp. ALOHA_ZT_67]MDE5096458.1 SH3 domain-containing protein [Trichodesmium sp. St11_bin5]
MSLHKRNLILAAITGFASTASIFYLTLQSNSSQFASNYLQKQKLHSNLVSTKLQPSFSTLNSSDLVTQESSPVIITPPTSGCKIVMAIVDDPEGPLNVRSIPEVKEGNIVGQLNNNTFISVADEQSGWLQITNPLRGWVAKSRTRSSCARVEQTITFSPGSDLAIVRGEIIGTGSHNYQVRMIQGQSLTIKNLGDVFPAIISPDDQLMTREPKIYIQGNESEWTGTMPVSGVYTLQLDSNFRGFKYEFLVLIKGNDSY